MSRIKRSRTGIAWLLPITSCDKFLHEMLQGCAFGAPGLTAWTCIHETRRRLRRRWPSVSGDLALGRPPPAGPPRIGPIDPLGSHRTGTASMSDLTRRG